jgi:hypothetical protein
VIIKTLDLAERDLIEGFRFYAAQEAGLGSYFLTNLYADIDLAGCSSRLSERSRMGKRATHLIDCLR